MKKKSKKTINDLYREIRKPMPKPTQKHKLKTEKRKKKNWSENED
jgi:hypothetical protein